MRISSLPRLRECMLRKKLLYAGSSDHICRDGFVLNVGREDWQKQRCIDCFAAAKRLPESTFFKFFISFDMTYVFFGVIKSWSNVDC